MPSLRKTIRLSDAQSEFRHSPALYRGFVGGIGSGKTWVGAYDLICRAKPGRTYSVASPTSILMGDTTYPTFKALAEELGVWKSARVSPYPNVTLTNGAVVRFRTAENPEKLRGPNLSGVWLDEASLMHEDAYKISVGRLRENGEQGWLSATFTPKGPTHWTAAVFASGRPGNAMIRAKTWSNPFNSPDYYRNLRLQYGDTNWARQELDGDFVQMEGAEFPAPWLTGEDLWFDAWPPDLVRKVVALDPSKGTDGRGEDYQAHVWVGARVEDNRWVYYVDADLRREGVVEMTRRTVDISREFSAVGGRVVDSVVVEDNATMGLLGPALEAAETRAGVLVPWVCRPSTDAKEFRVRFYVGPPLSRRQLRFRRTHGARMLVGQLQSFPLDEFDDGPDALASALRRMAEMLA